MSKAVKSILEEKKYHVLFFQGNRRTCQKYFSFFHVSFKKENNSVKKNRVLFLNKKLEIDTRNEMKQLVNIFYFMLCKDQFFITY